MIGPFALIIPTGVKLNGSDVFNILDPDSGGSATFSVPLSANGLAPVTHWGTSTWLEDGTHNALTNMTTTQFKAYVDQLATIRGRTPVGSITAFKNAILVSAQGANFAGFVAANGLQRVN
jgi:hypothetical protein